MASQDADKTPGYLETRIILQNAKRRPLNRLPLETRAELSVASTAVQLVPLFLFFVFSPQPKGRQNIW